MDVNRLTLYALAAACLLNLVLVLRLITRFRTADLAQEQDRAHGGDPLAIGAEAPDYNVQTLAGQPINNQRLAGRPVAYVFVSPSCEHCRDMLPVLASVGPVAVRAGSQVVLVADVGPVRARSWLDTVYAEDGVRVELPVLVAPPSRSMMVFDYNPPGLLPYFCLVGADGLVAARGHLGGADWDRQVAAWHAAAARDRSAHDAVRT